LLPANYNYNDQMPVASKTSSARRLPGKPLMRPGPKARIALPWSLRSANGTQILELAPFKKFPWLEHGFSTRTGGVSILNSGEKTLNLGFTDWDQGQNVQQNRKILQSAINASHSTLVPLRQFHSSVVRSFAQAPAEPVQGDASITNLPGLLLAIQTADCVPILLVDPKKRAIGAIHAGWRGTLARIAQKTVGEMQMRYGSKPADILAALGPAIGGCCYEVGTDLVTEFSSQFADAEDYFDELRTGEEPNPLQWLNQMPPGHQPPPKNVHLDLRKANRSQLIAAGLRGNSIFVSDLCTACHPNLFFSYRKEGERSGRLLAVICIR
jgi:YfiH family protein